MRGISWLAENRLASQGLCFMASGKRCHPLGEVFPWHNHNQWRFFWLRNYTWRKLVFGLNLVYSARLILLTSVALKSSRLQVSATVKTRPSVFCTWRVLGCSQLPIFRDCWTLEGWTVGLSRIVGDQIATYASYHAIRAFGCHWSVFSAEVQLCSAAQRITPNISVLWFTLSWTGWVISLKKSICCCF